MTDQIATAIAVNKADIVVQGMVVLKNRNEVSILILPALIECSQGHCMCIPIYHPQTMWHTHNKCCRCEHYEKESE